MTKSRSYLLAEVIDGEPNAETRIERLQDVRRRHFRRRHGAAAAGTRPRRAGCTAWSRTPARRTSCGCTWRRWAWASSTTRSIPDLLDKAPDDYTKPLQLLARGIRFVDPISRQPVEYRSRLELSEVR